MTDTECKFCGCSKLPMSGEGAETFTCYPNLHAKNETDPEYEDTAIVEVELVTKLDSI